MTRAESMLVGARAADRAIYDLVAAALDPTDDIHASGEYLRHSAATLTIRAATRALARARSGGAAASEVVARPEHARRRPRSASRTPTTPRPDGGSGTTDLEPGALRGVIA